VVVTELARLRVLTRKTADLSSGDKATIVRLCTEAFREDFSTLFQFVQTGDHVLAYVGSRLVGHAVWATRRLEVAGAGVLETAYVDAVATAIDCWGRGIGRRVMSELAVRTDDFELRALSTDEPAFYERIGWERWLGPLAVRRAVDDENGAASVKPINTRPAGVPAARGTKLSETPQDIVFVLQTARTPALDVTSALIADDRGGQPW
jgi:hypothetical protein